MRRTISFAALLVAASIVLSVAPERAGAVGTHDGVSVGSFEVTSSGTKFTYPILLNLSIIGAEGSGFALLPDDLPGSPEAMGYETLNSVVTKKKRLTVSVEVGEGIEARRLTLSLKTKKGALRGKISSNRDDIKGVKASLVRLDPESPLQQVWTGTMAQGRGNVAVALLLTAQKSPRGLGFIGTGFGSIRDLTLDGDRMTGTLVTPEGNTAIDLELNKKGHLAGTAEGARNGVVLCPAARLAAPRITRLSPQELASGNFTEVSVKGKNLAPGGFLFTSDQAGVTVSPPAIANDKKGAIRILANGDVPIGTAVALDVASPDGSIETAVARLTTSGSAPVSFSADLQPIFTASCALSSCHIQPPENDPLTRTARAPAGLCSRARPPSAICSAPPHARSRP